METAAWTVGEAVVVAESFVLPITLPILLTGEVVAAAGEPVVAGEDVCELESAAAWREQMSRAIFWAAEES